MIKMHIANYTAEKMSFCDKVSLFKLDVGRGHNVKLQLNIGISRKTFYVLQTN